MAFGGNDDPLRLHSQADRTVRKRCRHDVAIALEVYETGRRYPLAVLDKAVKGPPQQHQAGDFLHPYPSCHVGKAHIVGNGDEGAQCLQTIHHYPDIGMSEVLIEWIITDGD